MVQITSSNEECCARCVRSGCYVMLNGTSMEAQNNQLAIDNYHRDGVEMLKLEFGESIHVVIYELCSVAYLSSYHEKSINALYELA